MALAETQVLEVLLKFSQSGTGNITKVESELAGLNATASKTGGHTAVVSSGFGNVSKAAGGLTGALSHAKGAIGGLLTGPLGLIGLGAGLFTFSGLMKEAIGEGESLALAIEKLTGVTGENAQIASAQIAVFSRFGLAVEQAQTIAAFAEKTLGQLNITTMKAGKPTSHLIDLQKQYGVVLTDLKGRAVDFQTELLHVADYYTSNASAADKAALAAKLFGRGYVALIPLLRLGGKGFLEAEQQAKDLGLVLTKTNVQDVQKFIAGQRAMSEAVGGLKLQIALGLMPTLTEVSRGITNFLEHGGTQQIVGFFKGLVGVAKEIGGAVASLAPLAKGIAGVWDAIPPDFRKLLLGGLVANKVLKVVFGIDPIKMVMGGLTGGLLSRGSIGNPMWVRQVGLPGVGGGGSGPGGLSVLGIVGSVLGGLAVAALWKQTFQDPALNKQSGDLISQTKAFIASHPGSAALQSGLAGAQSGIAKLDNPIGQSLYGQQLSDVKEVARLLQEAIRKQGEIAAQAGAAANFPNTTPTLLREMVLQLKYIAGQGKVNADQANQLTKGLLGRSEGGSVQTLRGAIANLSKEQKTALAQGDVKTAAAIGRDIDQLGSRLTRVEASRAAMIERLKNAVVGVLITGFGGVIGAVHGISLPAMPTGAVNQGRGTGPGGRPAAPTYKDAGGGKRVGGRAKGGSVPPGWSGLVGEEGPEVLDLFAGGGGFVHRNQDYGFNEQNRSLLGRRRAGRTDPVVRFNPNAKLDTSQIDDRRLSSGGRSWDHGTARAVTVVVKASTTVRSNDSAGATQSRYGPTPSRAGAATVLI